MTLNLSFAGCGFLGIYHVGVACCFKQYAPHLLVDKIAGASAGAIAACCLLCRLPIGGIISDVLDVIREARKRTLGPFSPSFNVEALLRQGLERFLPEDAHKRVSGKLRISLTRVFDGKNVILSHFNTREELIQALLATSWVPLFSGFVPPKIRGTRYMDGGFSNNLPILDDNTITVSPFCGESDICPRDFSSQLFHMNVANTSIELSRENAWRIGRILFPPKPEILAKMCKQGFDDALRFLTRNNMINCTGCLSVQSTFHMSTKNSKKEAKNLEENDSSDPCDEFDPECKECRQHRKEAMLADMPEAVKTVFQDAIDSANRGFLNWVFRHRGMKLLSIMTVPYILPFEITYATCMKLVRNLPTIASHLCIWIAELLKKMSRLLEDVDRQRKLLKNNVICQLDVTQYGDFHSKMDTFQEKTRNHMNVLFRMDLGEEEQCRDPSKMLSRRGSLVLNKEEPQDEAIDQLIKVTHEHDAVMSYYYMDENNKMNVTEIFDVTAAESAAIFDPLNPPEKLPQFVHELKEEMECEEDCGLFSDPESEWVDPKKPGESSLEPESDQRKNFR